MKKLYLVKNEESIDTEEEADPLNNVEEGERILCCQSLPRDSLVVDDDLFNSQWQKSHNNQLKNQDPNNS